MFKFFEAINISFLCSHSYFTVFSPTGTIFLFFTLNAFCSFYMLSLKTFTIFQLIEKTNWIFLSAFGIFSLCFSTETTNKAITDCTTLLNTMYSYADDESINHKVEVCRKIHGYAAFKQIPICAMNLSFFHRKLFSIFVVHSNRLKSFLQRSSFKASRLFLPVDISTSIWAYSTRLCTHRLHTWWFYCSLTLSEFDNRLKLKATRLSYGFSSACTTVKLSYMFLLLADTSHCC